MLNLTNHKFQCQMVKLGAAGADFAGEPGFLSVNGLSPRPFLEFDLANDNFAEKAYPSAFGEIVPEYAWGGDPRSR